MSGLNNQLNKKSNKQPNNDKQTQESTSDKAKSKNIIKTIIIIFIICFILILLAFAALVGYRNAKKKLYADETLYLPSIVCIGDSLTQGTCGPYTSYPSVMEDLMKMDGYYMPVINYGIGGEDTTTISGRMGGVPFRTGEFTIPASGEPVPICIMNDDIHPIRLFDREGNAGLNPCEIAGVNGEITLDKESNQYYFTRTDMEADNKNNPDDIHNVDDAHVEDSDESYAKTKTLEEVHVAEGTEIISAAATDHNDGIYIIFMGENNGFADYQELIDQQKAILSNQTLNSGKYLIVGFTTGTAKERAEVDQLMENEYGDKFINIREYMANEGLNDAGIQPTEEDKKQMAEGMVPESLRSDDIHYNKEGYELLAHLIYNRIQELGYFSDVDKFASQYKMMWGLPNWLELSVNKAKRPTTW